jgi:hypothetical protein
MDSTARPTAGTGGAVTATSALDCDAAERALRIHGDHSHAAAHAVFEGAGPRPSPAACHHSSPHPRAVQLLLIDQQIASALPLAQ